MNDKSMSDKSMNDKSMSDEIKDIINQTVDQTILKLKMTGLIKDDQRTTFQKTECILKDYQHLKHARSEDGTAEAFVKIIDAALDEIAGDEYFEIIPMIYFENRSREEIAEFFNVTATTISRNKTRLIDKLKIYIFADEVVRELFL